MMYIEHHMKLSRAQIMKLAKGKKVRVKHSDLMDGEVKVFLTPQQAKRVETRKRKGLGVDLGPFDQAQLAHNIKFGMGFWDSFKRFLGNAARVVNANVIQPVMQGLMPAIGQARDRVVTRGVNLGQDLVERGLRRIGAGTKVKVCTCGADQKMAEKVAQPKPKKMLVKKQKKSLPEGLRKYLEEKKKMKQMKGEGFFDFIRPVAGVAAEEGLKQAAPYVGRAISGRGRPSGEMRLPNYKKTMGASFRLNKGL